jgi:PD-(D/E)XK nuclease superfamily
MEKSEKHLLEDAFYARPFKVSYSSMYKLLRSPKSFYKEYILKDKEDSLESYLVEGKVIHCLLLEDGRFDSHFILSPGKIPTYGTGERTVVDKVFQKYLEAEPGSKSMLTDFQQEILDIMKEINLHQKLKTDQQRIEKIVTPQNESYFDFLKLKGDKIIIDSETLDRCTKAVEDVKSNKEICELLGIGKTTTDMFGVYNETACEMDLQGYPFGLKGVIDNVVVDIESKKIWINDIKTTRKNLMDFPESVEYYYYWLQAVIYKQLVVDLCKGFYEEDWVVEVRFVVIDVNNMVYPYLVSNETMVKWEEMYKETLSHVAYHYNNRSYDLPYEFATGKITL